MTREEIIRKIRALFRLGDRKRNQSEAEALAALDAARRLMARYSISQADVDAGGEHQRALYVYTENIGYESSRGPREWAILLAQGIEQLTSTKLMRSRSVGPVRGRRIALVFAGHTDDVEIAAALFKILHAQIRRTAVELFALPPDLFTGRRLRGRWGVKHTSYGIGFATAVKQRADKPVQDLTPAEASTHAIVLANKQTWLQDEFKKLYPDLPTSEIAEPEQLDNEALLRGYVDGKRADIGFKHHLATAEAGN